MGLKACKEEGFLPFKKGGEGICAARREVEGQKAEPTCEDSRGESGKAERNLKTSAGHRVGV